MHARSTNQRLGYLWKRVAHTARPICDEEQLRLLKAQHSQTVSKSEISAQK